MDLLYDRARLIGLLKRDALKTGSFTLASGRSSHYYVDGRKVTLSAEGAARSSVRGCSSSWAGTPRYRRSEGS